MDLENPAIIAGRCSRVIVAIVRNVKRLYRGIVGGVAAGRKFEVFDVCPRAAGRVRIPAQDSNRVDELTAVINAPNVRAGVATDIKKVVLSVVDQRFCVYDNRAIEPDGVSDLQPGVGVKFNNGA